MAWEQQLSDFSELWLSVETVMTALPVGEPTHPGAVPLPVVPLLLPLLPLFGNLSILSADVAHIWSRKGFTLFATHCPPGFVGLFMRCLSKGIREEWPAVRRNSGIGALARLSERGWLVSLFATTQKSASADCDSGSLCELRGISLTSGFERSCGRSLLLDILSFWGKKMRFNRCRFDGGDRAFQFRRGFLVSIPKARK